MVVIGVVVVVVVVVEVLLQATNLFDVCSIFTMAPVRIEYSKMFSSMLSSIQDTYPQYTKYTTSKTN